MLYQYYICFNKAMCCWIEKYGRTVGLKILTFFTFIRPIVQPREMIKIKYNKVIWIGSLRLFFIRRQSFWTDWTSYCLFNNYGNYLTYILSSTQLCIIFSVRNVIILCSLLIKRSWNPTNPHHSHHFSHHLIISHKFPTQTASY